MYSVNGIHSDPEFRNVPVGQFDRSGRSAGRLNVIFAGEAIESGLRRNGREPGYGDA
jgi:hypothetical protein